MVSMVKICLAALLGVTIITGVEAVNNGSVWRWLVFGFFATAYSFYEYPTLYYRRVK
jgi:hypothetical protein